MFETMSEIEEYYPLLPFEKELIEYVRSIYPNEQLDYMVQSPFAQVVVADRQLAIVIRNIYEDNSSKTENAYQLYKFNYFDFNMLSLWSSEWNEKKDICKKMIANKLGVSTQPRIFARKTTFDPAVSLKEAKEFCNLYHIQGYAASNVRTGLRDSNNQLVALCLFKITKGVADLVRYCTSQEVVGGFSKVEKHSYPILKELNVHQVKTFADLAVSQGKLYEDTGWTKDKDLDPDYKYQVGDHLEHKFNYRLKRFHEDPNLLYKEGMTERELALWNQIPRVYDYGKIKYVKAL